MRRISQSYGRYFARERSGRKNNHRQRTGVEERANCSGNSGCGKSERRDARGKTRSRKGIHRGERGETFRTARYCRIARGESRSVHGCFHISFISEIVCFRTRTRSFSRRCKTYTRRALANGSRITRRARALSRTIERALEESV